MFTTVFITVFIITAFITIFIGVQIIPGTQDGGLCLDGADVNQDLGNESNDVGRQDSRSIVISNKSLSWFDRSCDE